MDPGPKSDRFYRIHLTADKFQGAHEPPQTILSLNVESCGRPDLSQPEPATSTRCEATYYVMELDNAAFTIDPNGAKLDATFGGQPLSVEWAPHEIATSPPSGRIFTETVFVGADAEYKTTADVTGTSVGAYKGCKSWGEFGVGVEEAHMLGRREIMAGMPEPRKFPVLDLRRGAKGAKCGDPIDTLRQIKEYSLDYDFGQTPGGALGIHLVEPPIEADQASYVSVTIADSTGLPTYGTILLDKNSDTYLEERHMFCTAPERPIRLPAGQDVPWATFEIQDGPCMYPRVEPAARATTGTITITTYR